MHEFLCVFLVNGHRTEQVVKCSDSNTAKRLIMAQYSGAKINWWSSKMLK